MKKLLKTLFAVQALIALFALTACSSDSEESSTISVDASTLKFEADGRSQTFSIQSNTNWTIIGNANWVQVSPASGSGSKSVVVSTQENTTTSPRSCTLNLTTDDKAASTTVLIVQAGTTDNISVDVSSLTLEGKAGSTGSIRITCNTEWKVTSSLDWVSLSSTSGNGSSQITLTTTSDNLSSTPRKGDLTITAGQKTINVTISQNGLYAAKCNVSPKELVVLSDGCAFDCNFDSNVAYYYWEFYNQRNADRLTDSEIIDKMLDGSRLTPGDEVVQSVSGLQANTDYVIYIVGFNKNGEHGDLIKTKLTTKKGNNQPFAEITDVRYNDDVFLWTTSPNGFVKHYYQYYITEPNYFSWADPAIAWLFKKELEADSDKFPPYLQANTQTVLRNGSDKFHLATWAVDGDGNLSGLIDRFRATVSSSSSAPKRLKNKKIQKQQNPVRQSFKYNKNFKSSFVRIH